MLAVAGCGFRPLYATREQSLKVREILHDISVSSIEGRVGREIRNQLMLRFHSSEKTQQTYRLNVEIDSEREALGIQQDESVTRYDYILTGNYRLVYAGNGEELAQGEVRAISSYDVVQSDFATLIASKDAEDRAAQLVSEEIIAELSVFLHRRIDLLDTDFDEGRSNRR